MSERRPLIGLAMRVEYSTDRFYLARFYCEALEAAGALPVHIALIPDPDYMENVAARMDGILLPGSDSDVDPLRYGAEPSQYLGDVHPEKDETDLMLLDHCEREGKPLFAICFGLQSLNVSRGGTLIQDISSQWNQPIKHQQGAPRSRWSHTVDVEPESRLAKIIGTQRLRVNSHHHQALDGLGTNLKSVAFSPDGIIEAAEDTRPDRWVIGVQWHPELAWEKDEASKRLFKSFTEASALYASKGNSEYAGTRDIS